MFVSPQKILELHKKMKELQIEEKDLLEKFILSSGPGGQKVQKSQSCVYLKHLPSGLEVKCQKSRFRELNRYFARKELCEKMEEKLYPKQSKKYLLQEKMRKQKKRKKRKIQKKIQENLENKTKNLTTEN